LVITVFGAVLTYQKSRPETFTETGTRPLYTFHGKYTHEAKVVENNPIWPTNKTLRNQPIYYLSLSPDLEGEFVFRILGADSSSGNFTLDTDLAISSMREENALWSYSLDMKRKTLNLSESSGITRFEITIQRIENIIENVQNSLDFTGGSINTKIVTEVTINGEIEGRPYENESKTYEMPLNIGGTTYSIGSNLSREETVRESYNVEREREVPLRRKIPYIILAVAPLIVLGYISFEWRRIDPSEIEEMKEEHERGRFDEWISKGKIPDLDFEADIKVESLEDLVDIAIDLERRVIYDRDKSIYYVLYEDMLYTYEAETKKLEAK
ncbi:hypothetical protein AKJ51_00440, partial [candidate division MSBL1 archaeon SCGC-AAA382A20]